MRRLLALLALTAACDGSDDATNEPDTGIRLTVEYESLLDVRAIEISGQFADGQPLEPTSHEVPLSLDPPGIRQVELVIPIAKTGPLSLRADGVDRSGTVLGSGSAEVSVVFGELTPIEIILGTPVVCRDGSTGGVCTKCGNGRVEPGEMCDDNNAVAGDGCSERCQLEGDIQYAFEIEQLETQTTTSATWVAVPGAALSFAPNSPAETWLIFASGKLRSTDATEITAEMRLMIDGVESDLFGHQTTGATDNWAGFVTFDRTTGLAKDSITAALEFRAEIGTTEVDDLRIVALRVPDGADFQYFEADEIDERAVIAGDLGTLRFSPSFAGEYFVFAKLNQSELPGVDTVRSWLEHDSGARHPNDPNGSTFSNGRAPWAPTFVAFSRDLDLRQHAFTLRGASSASGNAVWWDPAYDHRFPITVASSTASPAGYAIALTFDHAALVAAGRSLADGSDIRITRQGTELDRVLDPDSSWNQTNTTIWFSTSMPIATGATDAYFLYFGNPNAGLPPEDPALVFAFFDGFDGTALDPSLWTLVEGNASVNGGELVVGPQTRVQHGQAYAADTVWEVKSRLSAPVGFRLVWLGASGENATMSWFTDDSDHHAESNGFITHFDAMTPTDFHVWRIEREGTTAVRFYQDETPIVVHQTVPLGRMVPYFANETAAPAMIYDWVRIRPFVNPEPEVTVGELQSIRGGAPSRWSYRKIMAFRADAFESTEYAESLDAQTTTATVFQPITELTTDAPPGPRAYVSIQSVRISGISSLDARKSGELRADGAPLLATSHKINRTSEETSGYHHVAGAVDLRAASAPIRYQNGFYSPDGISVRAAESVIILLRLPSP